MYLALYKERRKAHVHTKKMLSLTLLAVSMFYKLTMLSPQVIVGSHGDIGDQTPIDIWGSLISEISATLSEYRSLGFSKSKAVWELTLLLNQKFSEWRNDRRRMAAAVESAYR